MLSAIYEKYKFEFIFFFKLTFSNFKKDKWTDPSKATTFYPRTQFTYHSPVHTIPVGIYDIDALLLFLNSRCNEFGINFYKENGNAVAISVGFDYRYVYKQDVAESDGKDWNDKTKGKYHYGDDYDGNKRGGMRIDFYLSHKLNYILGNFKDATKHFMKDYDANVYHLQFTSSTDTTKKVYFRSLQTTLVGSERKCEKIPDPYDGINKIYIYCEEVEKSMVGNSLSDLLCVVPLNYINQGSGQLISYKPPPITRKLIRKKIGQFNITLRDAEGELINFDSGSVNIEVVVF